MRHSHVTLVSRYPFFTAVNNIDHNMDVHYQVKHRLYICLEHLADNVCSLQGNLARSAANQSVRTIVASA